MNKKSTLTLTVLSILVAVVISMMVWLKPDVSTPELTTALASNADSNPAVRLEGSNQTSSPANAAQQALDTSLAPSLQDTEVDCALEADGAGQLVLHPNIKPCFEYYLTQLGEKPLNVIDQQVRAKLSQLLPASAAQQAIDLWQRYLKYREAESHLNVSGSNNDPDHLQAVMNALTQLRQKYFNPAELNALFGDEITYNQYTIDRLSILDNKALSAAQKAQQLKQRFAQLPQDLQKSLQDMSKLQDLRALTQQIRQKNGSKAELQQMREQLVGHEAAERLDQLDQSRASWQNRVQDYLSQRQSILNSNQAAEDKQQAITALRERQFSNEAERQRAVTYEHFKDQGTNISELLQ